MIGTLATLIRNFGREHERTGGRFLSISQDKYFNRLLDWLYTERDKLMFFGYDAPFMMQPATIDFLKSVTQHRRIKISSIIPEGFKTTFDDLDQTSGLVTILRTPEQIAEGYIVIGDWAIAKWDTTRSTPYGPEENTGVPFRKVDLDPQTNSKYQKKFEKYQRSLINKTNQTS